MLHGISFSDPVLGEAGGLKQTGPEFGKKLRMRNLILNFFLLN